MDWGLVFTSVLICAGCCTVISVTVIATLRYLRNGFWGYEDGQRNLRSEFYACFNTTMNQAVADGYISKSDREKCSKVFRKEVADLYNFLK